MDFLCVVNGESAVASIAVPANIQSVSRSSSRTKTPKGTQSSCGISSLVRQMLPLGKAPTLVRADILA